MLNTEDLSWIKGVLFPTSVSVASSVFICEAKAMDKVAREHGRCDDKVAFLLQRICKLGRGDVWLCLYTRRAALWHERPSSSKTATRSRMSNEGELPMIRLQKW